MNSFTTAEKTAYRFGFAMGHMCQWVESYDGYINTFERFIAEINEFFYDFTDNMIIELLELYDTIEPAEITKFDISCYDILFPNRKGKTIYIIGDTDVDDCIGMVCHNPEESDNLIIIPREEWSDIIESYNELNVLECECCGDEDHKNNDGEWTYVITRENNMCVCNYCYEDKKEEQEEEDNTDSELTI